MSKHVWMIILSLPLLLISCQRRSEKETQVLHLNFQAGDVPSLHPHFLEGHVRGRSLGKALFEGLTRINLAGEAELAGAQSVDISTCHTQYTFTLRDHLWSDGTPVTAFQYEKAWKQAIAPTSDCVRANLFYMIDGTKELKQRILSLDAVGIKALDDKTLFVKLASPAPYFLKLIASPIFAPIERTETEPYRFNGPFMVDKWKKHDLLILKANPYFWDHNQVSLKKIEIQMVADLHTNFLMHEKQKIDWVGNPFCQLTSEMVTHLREKGELQQQPMARPLWIYLNTQCPSLASAKIRQALSLAIDRSLITEHIYPSNVPLYKPLPSSLSLCSNTLIDNNLEQSKLLFEEGLEEIGCSRENFPSLTLSYHHAAGRKSLAEYLKETWEKAFGIKICLEGSEWNIFRSKLEKKGFQMGICAETALYPDPSELLEHFESIQTANFSQWEHSSYQEKLNLSKEVPKNRTLLLREAEELLLEELPFIPICNFSTLFACHPRLKGYVLDYTGCVDFRWAYFEPTFRTFQPLE